MNALSAVVMQTLIASMLMDLLSVDVTMATRVMDGRAQVF